MVDKFLSEKSLLLLPCSIFVEIAHILPANHLVHILTYKRITASVQLKNATNFDLRQFSRYMHVISVFTCITFIVF